jgi:hypothetical protein
VYGSPTWSASRRPYEVDCCVAVVIVPPSSGLSECGEAAA